MRPKHILVTGGAGFIGSNFVRWVLERDPEVRVTNLDLLTYAGNLESLTDVEQRFGGEGQRRYRFVHGDIRDVELARRLLGGERGAGSGEGEGRDRGWSGTNGERGAGSGERSFPVPDSLIHFAAESHVDRSIMGPARFVETNVNGTLSLLEACRAELENSPREFRFVQVSTDEVYGSLGPNDPPFTERTPLAPNSPYSASKAGADMLVRSYFETFGLPFIIARCSNNYGPYQFPEKLFPLMITRAIHDEPLPVYGDGRNVRDWLHVRDHCQALWAILERGVPGAVYNIGGEAEVANIEIVRQLLGILGKTESLIQYVTDRPGHDRRYAMDISRMREELGWAPEHTLEEGMNETVGWYLENRQWWERVLSEAYRAASEMYLDSS